MRRKDREMDRNFALSVIDQCEYAVLSMASRQGEPYCVPITIVRNDNAVYFHCAKEGRKIQMLRENPKVCLSCVGSTKRAEFEFTTEYESAVVFGSAVEVIDEDEKIDALRRLCQRHTPAHMDAFDEAIETSLSRTAVWKIIVDSITGKRKKYDKDGKEMKFGRME